MNLKQHEIGALFPPLSDAEQKALDDDVKRNGVRLPVWLYEGKVLDGWHRYSAAKKHNKEVPIKTYRGNDPAGFAYSVNVPRRHLKGSQLSHILASLAQPKWARRGEKASNPSKEGLKTTEAIAKEAKVGHATVERAKKVIVNGTAALNQAVRDGDISVSKASVIADLPKREQAKAIKAAEAKDDKPDHPATVPWEKYSKIEERLEEAESNAEFLADQLKTADAILKTDAAVEMMKLREEVKYLTRKRDALMNSLAECKKTCEYWRKEAKRCGWKAKGA